MQQERGTSGTGYSTQPPFGRGSLGFVTVPRHFGDLGDPFIIYKVQLGPARLDRFLPDADVWESVARTCRIPLWRVQPKHPLNSLAKVAFSDNSALLNCTRIGRK